MAWSFSSDRPVYIQVAERIRRSVILGEFAPGEQIPGVRQLAMAAAVNPNTVQHAFAELEDEGLLESRGTLGRFVTEDLEAIENCKKKQTQDLVHDFVLKSKELSISEETLITMIKEEYSYYEHS